MPAPFDARRPRPEPAERVIGPGGLPTYLISDEELAHGSSLGNAACWVPTKSTGAVERVFALNAGLDVFGACLLRCCGSGLRVPGPQPSPLAPLPPFGAAPERFALLEPSSPGSFEIHPAYQRHRFSLPGELEVEETVFLPWQGPGAAVPTVWVGVWVRNRSPEPRRLRVYGFADLCGRLYPDTAVSYDPGIGALVVRNPGRPGWSRMVAFDRPPSGYEAVRDRSRVYEPYDNPPLSKRTVAHGDVLAALQLDLELPPRGADSFCWLLCFSPQVEESARESVRRARDWEKLLNESISWCSEVLSAGRVMVPEKSITDGVLWAKANMLRVMGSYPTGAGFTNDPGRSSNVVVRDVAWFVFGCDHLMPEYSAELLRKVAGYQQESGKISEYWSALTGESEDYGLNINDATPLFVMAAGHHCLASHDRTFLREIYPAAARAARYLLSQRDERGLVFCCSMEVGERGICGWRNVIPNYRLSGAVTEVNAECYAALRTVAEMARALGRTEGLGYFLDAAVGLGDAINTHLLNPANGLYYLTIDPTGVADTDEILVCVGSSADGTVTVPLELRDLLSEDLWYYLEVYDSELDDWVRGMMRRGDELRELAVPVETRGFRLLRLTPVQL
ncbi:MAG: hypothetical protein ACYC3V_13000 [Chloroflexota bacterium]